LSLAEPDRALTSPAAGIGERYRLGPMILIVWIAIAAAALLGAKAVADSMSTDDLMRLVMVRDLLAGQGWFDLTQYRLDPPAGVVMHWSRIADLPVAAIVLALTPITGRAAAELAAAAFWPMLLFLPVLMLSAWIAGRMAGKTAALAAMLLVAVCGPVFVHFRPGAIDHHGLQLLLLLAATAGAMKRDRLATAGGGLAAALSLAVGLETLPALAALLVAVGLRWAVEGDAAARTASSFALAFATGAAGLFLVTVPAAEWSAARCDAFSLPWLAAAALPGGALALLAVTGTRLKSYAARLGAGVAAGAAAAAIFALAFPACLGDPYGDLDARMVGLWLGSVSEAQSITALLRNMPEKVLPFYGAPVAALALGGLALRRMSAAERIAVLPPLLVLAALTAVAVWQLRGAAAASLVAQAVLAATLVRLIGDGGTARARVRLIAALALLSSPALVLAGQGMGAALSALGAPRTAVIQDGPGTCRLPGDVAALQALRPGLVLASVDLGPLILAQTPHSVLAAPYHRNSAGNGAAFDMLTGDGATVRRALRERNVGYVVLCPGSPDHSRYARFAPDGLAARLGRGEVPDYLDVVPGAADAPLRIFRVRN